MCSVRRINADQSTASKHGQPHLRLPTSSFTPSPKKDIYTTSIPDIFVLRCTRFHNQQWFPYQRFVFGHRFSLLSYCIFWPPPFELSIFCFLGVLLGGWGKTRSSQQQSVIFSFFFRFCIVHNLVAFFFFRICIYGRACGEGL